MLALALILTPAAPLAPQYVSERTPYLERVIDCTLTRLSRLLRILRFHVHDLNLVPSTTDYQSHGKGRKRHLRFTNGDARLEVAYATHFI